METIGRVQGETLPIKHNKRIIKVPFATQILPLNASGTRGMHVRKSLWVFETGRGLIQGLSSRGSIWHLFWDAKEYISLIATDQSKDPNRAPKTYAIGALITRIGFQGFLYYSYHKEPQNPILIIKAPILLGTRSFLGQGSQYSTSLPSLAAIKEVEGPLQGLGALRNIGFCSILYYNDNKEPPRLYW